MKKSLLLYSFIVTVLMLIFTYMYFSKKVNFEEERYAKLSTKMKDSVNAFQNRLTEANHFTLENNDMANNYFENYDISKLQLKVQESLIAFNDSPNGNIYTGHDRMGDQKFIINKIKILNHRWIIAEYSNGNLWGDVLIKYFINNDETVSFEVIETVLYP